MRLPAIAFLLVLAAAAKPPPAASQVLVLNEYLAANAFGIEDEDGDHEDWLELYNTGPARVDLTGFALSDDPGVPLKWIFSRTVIDPGAFLLVFASDKDRRDWAGHLETVIDQGDEWRYRIGTSEPPSTWRTLGFDDSSWSEGPSGFGYGDGDDATIIPNTISLHIRKRFIVADPDEITFILLHVDYDDGFVAYLNDVEIARANVGEPGDHPPFDQSASGEHEALMYQGLPPEAFRVALDPSALLQPGTNVLAIQAHNIALDSSDMTMIPFMTLGMVAPPPDPVGTPEVLELELPNLHTNFKIDAAGEMVALRDGAGQLVDSIATGPMTTDVSRGRSPDGSPEWFFFTAPSPGGSNAGPGYPGFTPDPAFSMPAGFYAGEVAVSLSNSLPEAVTTYTTDGGDPSPSSPSYTAPLLIDSTMVVRARSFAPGLAPSAIQTRTYFIDEEITLPVVSLTTDPPNLWDEEIGIYTFGPDYNPIPPYFGANFWQDWERPVHVEYFAPGGALGFRLDAGVKIHGNHSRSFPQKSLLILARSGYGTEEIDYPLFEERENTRFKRIILRNAGQDWCLSMFRDAFCHRLAERGDIERMAYSPAIVFINGEYWGIHNIRERLDEHYLGTYFPVDPENLDILEDEQEVVEGDADHYLAMLDFIASHDLSLDENLEVVETMMETANFAEYCLYEIYLSNQDWPWTNIKYWRPRTPGGRWRWLYFDLDRTMGGYGGIDLERATDPDGPGGVHPWSTFLLVNLLRNEGFKNAFINRYADHLNTTFKVSEMLAHRDRFRSTLLPEVERHYARWEWPIGSWYNHMTMISTFITQRPAYAVNHILGKFGLPGTLNLTLGVQPPGSGRIRLTAITIDTLWSGTYFKTVPIPLTAVPAPGYAFAGWSDPSLPQEPSVTISPESHYGVLALFAPAEGGVVINEINYNSAPDFDPEDWVEFHNSLGQAIDISGWQFKDADDAHVYVFAPGTVLPAGDYLVLCRDLAMFGARFPGVTNVVGDMSFGLDGGGELVRLFDAGDVLADWVAYDDGAPWPPEPDGQGPTLELIDAFVDNGLAENWAASIATHGTPGAMNSVSTGTGIEVAAGVAGAPRRLELRGAYPNPFNPTTTFGLGIPERGVVRLSVHDTAGRLVRIVVAGEMDVGWHEATWDGRNEDGQRVASGIYFAELEAGGRAAQRKVVMLK